MWLTRLRLLAAAARHDGGYDLAPIAPVHAEVTIHRNDRGLRVELGHPNNARIRKRHRHRRELAHQPPNGLNLRVHSESLFITSFAGNSRSRLGEVVKPSTDT